MANQLIDDLLHSTDIVDIISKYVPLKRAGSNFSGCCPFHNEKTPSFMVSPTKQIFKCFGCGKGGNALSFLQEIERIDFWDAVKELAKIQHIDLSSYDTNIQKLSNQSDEKAKLKRMHTLAQNFFVEALQASPEALNYLTQTRQLSLELIQHFGIGLAPDKHYSLIQLLRSKGFSDNDLLEASLAKKNSHGEIYAFFRNRITFPIYDTMGNVIGFSARVLHPDDKPKYLNSAEHKAFEKSKVLYGLNRAKNHIREQQKLIIVEGQMDVLGLARLGYPIGVASSGTSLSSDHIKLLKRYSENIYLLFDNDGAGYQATVRALKLFYQQNIFPKIISLPQGNKDIDDLANTKNGKSEFEHCLNNAKDGFISIYEHFRSTMDINSPVDKQKLINALFELILSVNSLAIQEHYKQILAEKLGFAVEILNAQFQRYKASDGKLLLLQQERQQEQQDQNYQLERDALFVWLIAQEGIKKYLWDSQNWDTLLSFVRLLAQAEPGSILERSFWGTLSTEEEQQIDEMSLWWDQQLEAFSDPDKRYHIILQTLLPHLQKLLQLALKSTTLPHAEKQELLQLRKGLQLR